MKMNLKQSRKLKSKINYTKLKSKLENFTDFRSSSKRRKLIKIFMIASFGLIIGTVVNKPVRKYVRAIGFKFFTKASSTSSNPITQIEKKRPNCCYLAILTSFALIYNILRQTELMNITNSETIILSNESSIDDHPFALLLAIPIFTTMFRGMVPLNEFLASIIELIWPSLAD